ncbi:fumarylacetoacetate hydrolase family protein [Rhodovarius sp.]|uniref:fumarylacetoacetate hydrolase family protein n=1 Tax=Rhodovarius sp. TaxID=2972673 RepID=UPI0034A4D9CD
MRLGTAMLNGHPTLVAAMEDGLVALRSPALPETLLGVLQAGEAALVECARLLALAAQPGSPRLGPARIMAPFLPGKILGVGRNYADHAKEVGGPKLTAPRIFLKPSSSVVGPGAAVRIPPAVTKPDWEAELGVVIGRPAWQVPEGRALDHVAGYTVLNDVSAREFQFDQPLAMTSFAKGLDGFCPMGPWLVTADEVGEPWDLEVTCHLNGEEVQRGNTHDLIFSVPALIAYLSRYMELQPGDVIATGTPAGSGHFRTPPRYLKSGDQLRLEVARIGILEHSIA